MLEEQFSLRLFKKNIFQKIEFIILKMGRGNAIISSKYMVGQ